jgi:hypothetical protein
MMTLLKLTLPLVLTPLLLLTTPVKANGIDECDPFWIKFNMNKYMQSERVERLTVRAGSKNKCVTISANSNEVYDILRMQYNKRNALESKLRTKIDEQLRSSASGSVKHRYTNFELTGNLATKLTANSNGEILARVNGFGFKARAKYTLKNVPSIIAKVYANVSINNIVVDAKYDFMTGKSQVINVNPINLNINVDSRIFGFSVPLLSNYINNKLEAELRSDIANYLDTKTNGWSKALFSLDNAIPNDKFGNLGITVKQKLTSLLQGQYIEIRTNTKSLIGSSLTVDISGDFGIHMDSDRYENPCYIYADTPCGIPMD